MTNAIPSALNVDVDPSWNEKVVVNPPETICGAWYQADVAQFPWLAVSRNTLETDGCGETGGTKDGEPENPLPFFHSA